MAVNGDLVPVKTMIMNSPGVPLTLHVAINEVFDEFKLRVANALTGRVVGNSVIRVDNTAFTIHFKKGTQKFMINGSTDLRVAMDDYTKNAFFEVYLHTGPVSNDVTGLPEMQARLALLRAQRQQVEAEIGELTRRLGIGTIHRDIKFNLELN